MKNVLIIGATSAIAEATARRFANRGDQLYLLARNEDRLNSMSIDLKIRGASDVTTKQFDANNFDEHVSILDDVFTTMGDVTVVLIAHGTLPDQNACQKNFDLTRQELNTNAISTISLLTHIANKLEKQKHGVIAVITSVAGRRGRKSNYVYGAAKGMLSIFLQGLRNRLNSDGVNVLDIKPGFVDTPMTADFKKGFLWAQTDGIAKSILHGIDKGRNEIYTPFFWRFIMMIICNIPEVLFKKMNL